MTNIEYQSTIFKKAAENGNIPDKDAVQEALDEIPNCYSALGCKREGKNISADLWRKFYDGNRKEQINTGAQIIAWAQLLRTSCENIKK